MPILIKSGTKEPPVWRERLISCGLFLIFSLLFFYTARDVEQEYRLYRNGIYTQGTALKCVPVKGGYDIDYEFNYKGFTYQTMSDAKESWLNSAKFPTPIRVHFLASDPNISRVPEVREYSLLWMNIFFCSFYGVAVFVLGASMIRECLQFVERRRARGRRGQPWHLPTHPRAWH